MKRLVSIILVFVVIFSVNGTQIMAAKPNWQDAGIPVAVPLDANNVFEIRTAAELAWVAQKVNAPSGSSTFAGYTVKLMNDIDLSAREWTPIGGWNGTAVDTTKRFDGTFDGNNKVIKGLKIGTSDTPESRYQYIGLFGYCRGTDIKSVGLETVEIYSNYDGDNSPRVAGLVGDCEYGTIINCYVTGNVSNSHNFYAYNSVGGLAAATGGTTITNCFTLVNVFGSANNVMAGGLVGFVYYSSGGLTNCYAGGTVTAPLAAASGGLIGYAYYEAPVKYCYFNSDTNDNGIGVFSQGVDTTIGKSAAEMKSQAFVDLLNENITLFSSAGWIKDTANKNQGFPIFGSIVPNSYKYWFGNAVPVTEKSGGVYEIASAQQLAWISAQVLNGNTFAGKTVKLMNNIDLSGKEWTPIGGWNGTKFDIKKEFLGTFNGNYMKIIGLRIGAKENPCDIYESVGLFGLIWSGTIMNVGLENVQIYSSNSQFVGALAGRMNYTAISNCYSTGTINKVAPPPPLTGGPVLIGPSSGNAGVGGLVGSFSGDSINNCYSLANVSSISDNVGGLCGFMEASTPSSTTKSCYAIGNLDGKSYLGGLIGSTSTYEKANSYWNKTATHTLNGFTLADGAKKGVGNGTDTTTGRTFAELKIQSNFTNWDFKNTWAIDPEINNGLPYLRGFTMDYDPLPHYTINSVSLTDTSGGAISAIPASGNFNVKVNITQQKANQNDNIITVLYGAKNKVLGFYRNSDYLKNSIGINETKTFYQSVSAKAGTAITKIKVFIWSGMETAEPLSNVGSYPAQ